MGESLSVARNDNGREGRQGSWGGKRGSWVCECSPSCGVAYVADFSPTKFSMRRSLSMARNDKVHGGQGSRGVPRFGGGGYFFL